MVQNVTGAVTAEEQEVAVVQFEIGDLAMCHAGSNWRNADGTPKDGPQAGFLGYVTGVRMYGVHLFVAFSRWPNMSFNAHCFTRMTPHRPDKQDMETLQLIRRAPRPKLRRK